MDRYEVKISLGVNKVSEDGKKSDFHDSGTTTFSVPYEGVIAIQQLMLGVVNEMGSWGIAMAVADGLGDKLKALGVKVD